MCVGLVIFSFLARGIRLRLPAVTNQRENFSGCQMSFKCAVLDFCPPSCQLARSVSFFFSLSSLIFPADLAEVHGERKRDGRERERVNIF